MPPEVIILPRRTSQANRGYRPQNNVSWKEAGELRELSIPPVRSRGPVRRRRKNVSTRCPERRWPFSRVKQVMAGVSPTLPLLHERTGESWRVARHLWRLYGDLLLGKRGNDLGYFESSDIRPGRVLAVSD